jgi:hypothetical protein
MRFNVVYRKQISQVATVPSYLSYLTITVVDPGEFWALVREP